MPQDAAAADEVSSFFNWFFCSFASVTHRAGIVSKKAAGH